MNTRLKYKTKQREILIEYLEKFQGKHITASDVYEYFRSQGESIGAAAQVHGLDGDALVAALNEALA